MKPISAFRFSFLLILAGTVDMPRAGGQEYPPNNRPVNGRPVNGLPVNGRPLNGPPVNNGHAKGGVSEGHRLITRALWRIFDALMQKKDHGELYSRTQEMQSVLKDLVTEDTKLRQQYRNMKDEIELWRSEASTMRKEMEALLGLRQRVESLETWQQTMQSQRDQDIRRDPQKDVAYLSRGPTHTLEAPSSSSNKHEDNSDSWVAAAAYTSCPLPYELVGNECFHITRGAKRSWMGARRECGELGGDLAAPRDLKALRDYLMRYPDAPEYLWIGASRIQETWSPETQTTHTWAWATGPMAGKPLDMSNSTWNEGLPSGAGNCVGLFNEAHFRAYDYKCSEPDLYVCQFFY